MTPFRDDEVWRRERAAELDADRVELEATLARAEATLRASRRARSAFAKVRSLGGVALLAIALAAGYVAAVRWGWAHTHECG